MTLNLNEFTQLVIQLIAAIPRGKVDTYGGIAKKAGNPRAARQVSRILHSQTKKHNLPWHRVISSSGKISYYDPELQKDLLTREGVIITLGYKVDLKKYLS